MKRHKRAQLHCKHMQLCVVYCFVFKELKLNKNHREYIYTLGLIKIYFMCRDVHVHLKRRGLCVCPLTKEFLGGIDHVKKPVLVLFGVVYVAHGGRHAGHALVVN